MRSGSLVDVGPAHNRPGITLLETLVAIAIITVLLSLGTWGVMSAREASRRTTCANNLRQIGLAIHNYTATHGVLPPGANGTGYSFLSMLLPYLEANGLYSSCNFQITVADLPQTSWANYTAACQSVGLFLCPSDRSPGGQGAWTSYAGNRGCGVQKYGYNGAFPFEVQGPINYSAFRDGTSSTVAVAEWILGRTMNSSGDDRRRYTFKSMPPQKEPDELDNFASTCDRLDSNIAKIVFMPKGYLWLRGDLSYSLYTHVLPINHNTCTNGTAVQLGAWTAGSFHRGGAHALFIDGHTRFIRESLGLANWRALGSRSGAEVVASEDF